MNEPVPTEEELVEFKKLIIQEHPAAVEALSAYVKSQDEKTFNSTIMALLLSSKGKSPSSINEIQKTVSSDNRDNTTTIFYPTGSLGRNVNGGKTSGSKF